ncbi:ACP S-malonyltransferase [Streptomyces guryensis]|uniref:Malonyl CoA-acyl carrier protein transacylase n=1 Tax=Streptomyces guryensis TaxID=2886947 RepID=A0A9Q3Z860_9ACTN|nr:ACP S-malonyltransferase [Streptomyces guryensis]MCD9878921.1 ACP S-malonyltransferase [Streptomyces guryensis]
MQVIGFPGQGSQAKGMGRELFARYPELVAQADEELGYSIERCCIEDPRGELRNTRLAQPALYVVEALAYLQHRQDHPEPDVLMGHSVGEYAALFAAGVFDFATGLRLVRRRGELMADGTPGTMAALLGLDLPEVQDLLERSELTELDVALHNAPGQVALAGPEEAVDRLVDVAAAADVRCVRLNVSGPFHSRYMRRAAQGFAEELARIEIAAPRIPVVANATALPHEPGRVADALVAQITRPVLWRESVERLLADGDLTFVELGPGTTLTGMVQRIRRAVAAPL